MLAVGGSSRTDACSDAELIRTHEVGPLAELLSGAKTIAVNETIDEAAVAVGAVVIELAPLVASEMLILVKSPWLVICTYWYVFTKWTP